MILVDILKWCIQLFRKPMTFYIIISLNSIKIQNLFNSKSIHGKGEFSNNRQLIADPIKAESLCRELFCKIASDQELFTRSFNIIYQPLDKELGVLSKAENMIFIDLFHRIGGARIYLIEGDSEFSIAQLKQKFEKKIRIN